MFHAVEIEVAYEFPGVVDFCFSEQFIQAHLTGSLSMLSSSNFTLGYPCSVTEGKTLHCESVMFILSSSFST